MSATPIHCTRHLWDLHLEWDQTDFAQILSARRGELLNAGVRDPSSAGIQKAITREELACHCKQQTRANGAQLFSEHMMGSRRSKIPQVFHMHNHQKYRQGRSNTASAALC